MKRKIGERREHKRLSTPGRPENKSKELQPKKVPTSRAATSSSPEIWEEGPPPKMLGLEKQFATSRDYERRENGKIMGENRFLLPSAF